MNADEIPRQLEELFDRARATLDAQITKARTAVDSLNAEKAVAERLLGELRAEHKQVQTDLKSARAYLHRGSTLASLDGEITSQRKALDALKHEKAELEKAVGALTLKRTEVEARVVALENDARLATAERARAQEMIAGIKNQLQQWS
jgi:chromosome segregation ATPase